MLQVKSTEKLLYLLINLKVSLSLFQNCIKSEQIVLCTRIVSCDVLVVSFHVIEGEMWTGGGLYCDPGDLVWRCGDRISITCMTADMPLLPENAAGTGTSVNELPYKLTFDIQCKPGCKFKERAIHAISMVLEALKCY